MFRPKMGFGVPIDQWFRGELRDYMYQKLLSPKALSRNLFRESAVRAILDEHCQTTINHAPRIWALLTLELWFEAYFD